MDQHPDFLPSKKRPQLDRFLRTSTPPSKPMSFPESLVHHQPRAVAFRMEAIDPAWPKYKATLDLPPQENRDTLSGWSEWLQTAIPQEKENLRKWWEEDCYDNDRLRCMWLIESLLQLPWEVIVAARKRLFGEMPSVDENGEHLFSHFELHLIAGAFWRESPARMDYLPLKAKAEQRAKRSKEVNDIFRDLRKELNG